MIRVTNRKEMYQPAIDLGDSIKVAFDYEVFYDIDEEGNKIPSDVGTWTEAIIKPKPSLGQIKSFILNAINNSTDEKILTEFTWNGSKVWLSSESQFNYKVAYDLAVQTNGANLPVTFKFGSMDEPVYHEFTTIEELQDFYLSATAHINSCLQEGWKKKDSINWNEYEEVLNKK